MALVNLQFIQYNNYFNKILKKPENPFFASSYEDYPEKAYITGVSFNENDGVTTSQVVNNDIDDVGDYLLVLDGGDNVISHWFVIEATRNRLGQCVVRLQRDLLVDYYAKIRTAPAFIERGMLNNDDPMIFNDEGLSYNQIKASEELLYDKTRCGWIVGYLSKSAFATDTDISADVTFTNDSSETIPEYSSWSELPQELQQLIDGTISFKRIADDDIKLCLDDVGYIHNGNTNAYHLEQLIGESTGIENVKLKDCSFNTFGNLKGTRKPLFSINAKQIDNRADGNNILYYSTSLATSRRDNLSSIKNSLSINDEDIYNVTEEYGNTKIKVAGVTYLLKKNINPLKLEVNLNGYSILKSSIVNSINTFISEQHLEFVDINGQDIYDFSAQDLIIRGEGSEITLEATPAGEKVELQIKANRQKTIDAQYDMFAIPYGNMFFYVNSRIIQNRRTLNKEASLAIAQKIAIAANDELYDLQILPYCPMQGIVKTTVTSSGLVESIIIKDSNEKTIIKNENNTAQTFILWCSHSSFELQLSYDIPKSSDAKSQKTLEKYRMSGGNYASMFEFTPDMNGGVDYFNVYCDYRPYKPFIKINPSFSYLYGSDYKDPLGLILSGDFSLTIMKDAWESYKLNNKNYEAMFDRGIQSVELSNSIAYQNSVFSALAGTLGGTATGAVAGGMKGGIGGAIAGAVVGGVASGVGGIVDVSNQDALRTDALNLQKQQHSYMLDNIKALPNTIQKISSMVQINKIVPVLEHYTCTVKERESFENYIKYNGMTVGRIDTIQNFESNGGFIQGRFIRLEGLSEDYHLAKALNETFQAGFYFMEEE